MGRLFHLLSAYIAADGKFLWGPIQYLYSHAHQVPLVTPKLWPYKSIGTYFNTKVNQLSSQAAPDVADPLCGFRIATLFYSLGTVFIKFEILFLCACPEPGTGWVPFQPQNTRSLLHRPYVQ